MAVLIPEMTQHAVVRCTSNCNEPSCVVPAQTTWECSLPSTGDLSLWSYLGWLGIRVCFCSDPQACVVWTLTAALGPLGRPAPPRKTPKSTSVIFPASLASLAGTLHSAEPWIQGQDGRCLLEASTARGAWKVLTTLCWRTEGTSEWTKKKKKNQIKWRKRARQILLFSAWKLRSLHSF